jgi:hypothetical protein
MLKRFKDEKLTQRGDCGEKQSRTGLLAVGKKKESNICENGWMWHGNLNFTCKVNEEKLTFWAKTMVLVGRERTKRGPAGQ